MPHPVQLLRWFGLALCLLSASFTVVELLFNTAPGRTAGCMTEVLANRMHWPPLLTANVQAGEIAVFAVLFWWGSGLEDRSRLRTRRLVALACQSLIGLMVGSELLVLVSFQVGLLAEVRLGLWCISILSALQMGGYYLQPQLTRSHPLFQLMEVGPEGIWFVMMLIASLSVIMHFLALSLGLLAAVEKRRAQELDRVNAELRATRQLEADTARVAERLSLSRELHDASGHHLAALNVNLRLIRHLNDKEKIRDKLDECLLLVQNLLSDVRGVVRDLRDLEAIDLRSVLQTMASGLTGLKVHLDIGEELTAAEPYHAHVLFRCAQEIMTNTLKHSEAPNLWLAIRRVEQGFQVDAHDDGRGASHFQFGNGLGGMRDRVAELGGSFSAQSRVGEGFRVELLLPVRGRAA